MNTIAMPNATSWQWIFFFLGGACSNLERVAEAICLACESDKPPLAAFDALAVAMMVAFT